MSEKEKDVKIESNQGYELGFHLVPTLGDDAVGKAFDDIIKLVEKVGGKVVSKSEPALLNLEYSMDKTIDSVRHKYNTAYFAWIIFKGGDVQKLGEEIEHNKNMLRQLLIKTDQQDSIKTEAVAAIVNEEEETDLPQTNKREKKEEPVEEVEKAEEIEESVKAEEESDQKKVDDAIDELVK